jgi:hypothetical protein
MMAKGPRPRPVKGGFDDEVGEQIKARVRLKAADGVAGYRIEASLRLLSGHPQISRRILGRQV